MVRYIVVILAIVGLTACTSNPSVDNKVHDGKEDQPEFKPYTGPALDIAVIGEKPDIKEEHIQLKQISFADIKDMKWHDYDAVFIMKEYLKQAAQPKYVKLIKSKRMPFFYFDYDKQPYVFMNEEVTYEEGHDIDLEYASGYYYKNGKRTFTGYSLHNDKRTKESIQHVYSRIFETIDKK